jgi:hypothetical protein
MPWIAVVIGALLVAILKPWGPAAVGPSPSESDAGRSPSAAHPDASTVGVADPTANAALRSVCHNTDAWLLATLETSRGQTLRVLRVVAPIPAGRAIDPSVPRVVFGSEGVAELGWCAPVVGPERSSGIASVTARAVADGHSRQIVLDSDRAFDGSGFGTLYRPPAGTAGPRSGPTGGSTPVPTTWPSGIYVFTIVDTDGTSRSFGVDLEIMPGGWPSAGPSTRPASSR